jgi:trk system potassium uptake protein TrkH
MQRQAFPQASEGVLRWGIPLLVVVGLATLVTDYGFRLSSAMETYVQTGQAAVAWAFLGTFLLRLLRSRHYWAFLKRHVVQAILMVLLLVDLVAFHTAFGQQGLGNLLHVVDIKRITVLYVAFIQGFLVVMALLEAAYYSRSLVAWQIKPAQTLVLSFVALIAMGCLLLLLPEATTTPGSLSVLQALFTATSAVCVTGLIVVDTATAFTALGQGIILVLFQLGGLGIITFATVIGMMVRGSLGIREKVFLQDFVTSRQFGEISATVRRIVLLTLWLEALGACSLYLSWGQSIPDVKARVWHAVFHAVSAFCNAGFSTFSDSLARPDTAMHAGVNITVMVLIVLGGLGFAVLWEGWQRLLDTVIGRPRRLSVQLRLVCLTTALLIVAGAGLFAWLEADGVLAGHGGGERLLGALFQSITARTAGFNTLPIDTLAAPTTVLLIILMLVGASPGSTGGGIKTTTIAVLLMTTVATIRGKARVEAFRRTIPWTNINQAYATFFFTIAFITAAMFILCMTEAQPFLDIFFEEVSAFATVGLSRGITPLLSNAGKLVVIVSMFVGRVGSLTLGVALARQVSTTAYEYPPEAVTVG